MRAAMYLRQSLANGEGIERQRSRCRALIDARDWTLVQEYVDDDVSASKTRGPGTAWHAMLNAKGIDVIVAVNLDRLLRQQKDLIALIESGMKVTTLEGEIDLTSASGEMQASVLTAMARFEARRKGERQVRANAHRRERGLPPGGRRAFGYTVLSAGEAMTSRVRTADDGTTWPDFGHEPHPVEAGAVRQGYALALAGASLRSIAARWNAEGLTTTLGFAWDATTVRAVLSNPRNAGLVPPPREPGAPSTPHYLSLDDLPVGAWEPLVDVGTWKAARDLLADPGRRSTSGPLPKTLLSGIARCGLCGSTVRSGVTNGIRLYRCNGSGHMSRKRDDADHFIQHVILDRLARPEVAEAILRREDGPDVSAMRADLLAAQTAESNVLALVSQGLTTMDRAAASLRDVRERIGALDAAITDAGRESVLTELLGQVTGDYDARWAALAVLWESIDIDRQRAVVRALVGVSMRSPRRGSRPPKDEAGRLSHTEDTIDLTWRYQDVPTTA